MNKIEDIKKRFEAVREPDFLFQFVDTQFSLTIVITDKEASFEELYHIDKSDENKEQVHCVTEGDEYTRMTLDAFHAIVKENWQAKP